MIDIRMLWEFFKTGLFAVGGGLATLPFLTRMSTEYGWFTREDIGNMIAVSEATPGPIGVNMATYVGSITGGVFGGVLTTLCLILPSYLVILLVQGAMKKYSENLYVQGVMRTLRPASVGMICAAVVGILQAVLFNTDPMGQMLALPSLCIFAVLLFVFLKFPKLHPAFILAGGAAAGILLKL